MSRDWYETYANRFRGYRQLWNSRIEGENGEIAFTAWLRQTIPSHPRVLDVGCGDGLYTLHMSALATHITGVDYAPTVIELARRNQQSAGITNVDFQVCDTSREPLPGLPEARPPGRSRGTWSTAGGSSGWRPPLTGNLLVEAAAG